MLSARSNLTFTLCVCVFMCFDFVVFGGVFFGRAETRRQSHQWKENKKRKISHAYCLCLSILWISLFVFVLRETESVILFSVFYGFAVINCQKSINAVNLRRLRILRICLVSMKIWRHKTPIFHPISALIIKMFGEKKWATQHIRNLPQIGTTTQCLMDQFKNGYAFTEFDLFQGTFSYLTMINSIENNCEIIVSFVETPSKQLKTGWRRNTNEKRLLLVFCFYFAECEWDRAGTVHMCCLSSFQQFNMIVSKNEPSSKYGNLTVCVGCA